jgi:SAM-dependent methyltransferase
MGTSFSTALKLISSGQWRTIYYKLWLRLNNIDLDYVSLDDLGLSEDIAHYHSTTPGEEFRKLLKALKIPSGKAIIDFGCGKGGALITMAKFPFSIVAGCDIAPALLEVAKTNMKKLKLSNVRLYCSDARMFYDLDEYEYFYFHNPFPKEVLLVVLKNIASSLEKKPREAMMIYRNQKFDNVVMATGLFQKLTIYENKAYYLYQHSKDKSPDIRL